MKLDLRLGIKLTRLLFCIVFPSLVQGNTIQAVFFLPLTGPQADLALDQKTAAELAIQNASLSHPNKLAVTFADNYNNPDSAVKAAKQIALNDEVKLFLGGYPSSCCRAINEVAEEFGIPHLITAASDDQLTQGLKEWTFRINPPSSDYNDALLSWMVKVVGKERSLAILSEDSLVYAAARDDINDDLHLRWSGKTTVFSYAPGTQDFLPIINILQVQKPSLIYLLGSSGTTARFLRQCRELDYLPDVFVLGSVHFVNNRFAALAAEAAEGALAPLVWQAETIHPEVAEFARAFTEKTGAPPDYRAAEAYAAIQVAVEAAAEFKSPPTRNEMRSALINTDMNTVFGRVRFESYKQFHNQNRSATLAVQLQEGSWITVWPPALSEKQFIYPLPSWRKRALISKPAFQDNWIVLIMILGAVLALLSAAVKRRDLTRKINQ